VAEGIVRAATEVQPDLILAPQGIGGHVDHVQVVHAIRIAALRAPVLWWRDFPYVVRDDEPREPFRAAMEALPEGAVALSEDARARKRAACLAYHSQIGFQFGGEAGLDRRLDATGAWSCSGSRARSRGMASNSAREPDAPKSLADPGAVAMRRDLLGLPHMAPLVALAAEIRAAHGFAPDADPLDGGAHARLLILLETPGPRVFRSGFVSGTTPRGPRRTCSGRCAGPGSPGRTR
jgi:hypothetical protein